MLQFCPQGRWIALFCLCRWPIRGLKGRRVAKSYPGSEPPPLLNLFVAHLLEEPISSCWHRDGARESIQVIWSRHSYCLPFSAWVRSDLSNWQPLHGNSDPSADVLLTSLAWFDFGHFSEKKGAAIECCSGLCSTEVASCCKAVNVAYCRKSLPEVSVASCFWLITDADCLRAAWWRQGREGSLSRCSECETADWTGSRQH